MRKFLKIILVLIIVGGAIAEILPYFITGDFGHKVYQLYIQSQLPNVIVSGTTEFYISTGTSANEVAENLFIKGIIKDKNSFLVVSTRMNYCGRKVVSGKYLIQPYWSNRQLISNLRGGLGAQTISITFNTIRTHDQLAGKVSRYIEADSVGIINWLNSSDSCAKYGFNENTIISMFIPNTYSFYWNTSAWQFMERMAQEYRAFWTDKKKQKAKEIGLSQTEVATLASILQEESNKQDELARIAGVYMNRLKINMLLQSDPTLKFAKGDFSIKRLHNSDKLIDSPYNTYQHAGLPPGPIAMPEISSMNAVLNYEEHDFLYFCAKEDFSGYHNFAKTYKQHRVNAAKFHAAMDRKNIYR